MHLRQSGTAQNSCWYVPVWQECPYAYQHACTYGLCIHTYAHVWNDPYSLWCRSYICERKCMQKHAQNAPYTHLHSYIISLNHSSACERVGIVRLCMAIRPCLSPGATVYTCTSWSSVSLNCTTLWQSICHTRMWKGAGELWSVRTNPVSARFIDVCVFINNIRTHPQDRTQSSGFESRTHEPEQCRMHSWKAYKIYIPAWATWRWTWRRRWWRAGRWRAAAWAAWAVHVYVYEYV
jgi:hypothetical protein